MLGRPLRSLRAPWRTSARLDHTHAHATYHHKVRALPFVLTKDEAIEAMNDHAAGLSLNFGHMAKAFMRGLFTSLDIPALTPSRIQAVYLPTWVVDAEVEAKVYGMNEDDKDSGTARLVTAHITNSFVPGFVYDPLSRVCFGRRQLFPRLKFVPYSDDLRTQLGSDVVCLPYTMSPLSLPAAARNLQRHECEFGPGLRFDPSTIQTPMIAAYPVLMPVYLATYEFPLPADEQKIYTLTLMMDASISDGVVYTDGRDAFNTIDATAVDFIKRIKGAEFDGQNDILVRGQTAESFIEMPAGPQGLDAHLNSLAVDKMHALGARPPSAHVGPIVDMDDVRVRPWAWEDSQDHNGWIMLGVRIALTKAMHAEIRRMSRRTKEGTHGVVISNRGAVSESDGASSVLETLESELAELEKKRVEMKPLWLKTFDQKMAVATSPKA